MVFKWFDLFNKILLKFFKACEKDQIGVFKDDSLENGGDIVAKNKWKHKPLILTDVWIISWI